MTRSYLVLIVAVALLLAAAPAMAQKGADLCAKVVVSNSAGAPQLAGGSFSARKVEDLRFSVLFLSEVEGDHLLELKVWTPRGHLYETLTAPISSRAAEGAQRVVPNYPRPLEVQVLERVVTREGTFFATGLTFPVGGTAIVANSLYGRWRVDVLLDGQPMACEVVNAFVLTE